LLAGVDLFTRKIYKDIAIESFKYCQINKGLRLFAYVIMSNHIHLIAKATNGDLSDVVRDIKSYTSRKFLESIYSDRESRRDWMKMVFEYHAKYKNKQNNQIWTHENYPEEIYSQSFMEQKLEYIHNNPVKAGIVAAPEDYLYSSARNYAGHEAVMEVEMLDIKWKSI
jgi:REP element-mobilizing transposase RayT